MRSLGLANIQSAKKQARQNERRKIRNRVVRSSTTTAVKNARLDMDQGNLEGAIESTREAISKLDRAASKGVIHRNNASRRKSRLMKRLAALQAQKGSE
jgi:small subunit ribosomal protein S20